MILFSILKWLLGIGILFTNFIGSLGTPELDFSWADGLVETLDVVLFLFPLEQLEPLLLCVFVFTSFRIGCAIVNFLRKMIPFM